VGRRDRLIALVTAWCSDAERLSEYFGLDQHARLMQRMASELEAALRADADDLLNLRRAAQETGYSEDHLGRLVAEGKLPNAGRKHAPRIRRGDLPEKTGARAPDDAGGYDTERLFQDIVASKLGR
jgi:hypothetical protein